MRLIKEMRLATGMSQSQFAKKYNIPVSTLRKWEQGESRPPAYVVELISNAIPSDCDNLVKITASNGKDYYTFRSFTSIIFCPIMIKKYQICGGNII